MHVLRVRIGQARPDMPTLFAVASAVGGALILAGWAFNLPLLTTILPGRAPSARLSALAFILAGASLWLLGPAKSVWRAQMAARACAGGITALGLLSRGAQMVGWDLGYGAQPAVATSAGFVVVGTVLLLLSARRPRLTAVAQVLVLPVMYLALAGFAAYLLGASTLHFLAPWATPPPLPTTFLFLLLSRGLLERDTEQGFMAVITATRPGGFMARRLLAAFTWISLGLGWLLLRGEHAGLYDGDLLVALFVVFNILLTSLVVVHSARSLNRADAKREHAEEELGSANAERQQRATMIQSVLESIGDGVIIVDPDDNRLYNRAAKRILGIDLSGLAVSEWNQKLLVFRPDQKTILPPDEFPTARASRGETVDDMEVFVRHAGAPKGMFISASARPLRNERGESQGVVAIFRDLTTRRQAEEM